MRLMTTTVIDRILFALLVTASVLALIFVATPKTETGDYYPRTFVVDSLDYERDMVIVVDTVGYEWEFCGTEDWEVGDLVSAVMYSRGTKTIFDDSFSKIRYAGNIDPATFY